jgi:hypothetical protein
VRLVAHCLESRPRTEGADFGICQTFAASPAEPGELPCWFRTSGRAPSLEAAKVQFLTNWRKCRADSTPGRDHVRKYDEVAQWQHRISSGFTWRKRWEWLSGHGPKSVLWFLNTVVSRLDDKRLGPILGPIPAGPRSAGGAMKPPLGEPVPAFTPSTPGWRGAFLASRSSVAVRCSC